jgi:hypothetical protein
MLCASPPSRLRFVINKVPLMTSNNYCRQASASTGIPSFVCVVVDAQLQPLSRNCTCPSFTFVYDALRFDMSSQSKPSSPPPAYTEVDPALLPSSSGTSSSPTGFTTRTGTTGYGPTSITAQQQTILPYYDPRSPHALAEAMSRARWRFLGALFWAVLILACTSLLLGIEVDIQRQPWRGNRVRISIGKGNRDPWMDQ